MLKQGMKLFKKGEKGGAPRAIRSPDPLVSTWPLRKTHSAGDATAHAAALRTPPRALRASARAEKKMADFVLAVLQQLMPTLPRGSTSVSSYPFYHPPTSLPTLTLEEVRVPAFRALLNKPSAHLVLYLMPSFLSSPDLTNHLHHRHRQTRASFPLSRFTRRLHQRTCPASPDLL